MFATESFASFVSKVMKKQKKRMDFVHIVEIYASVQDAQEMIPLSS